MHENISEYLYAHKYHMLTMLPQNFFNLCTRPIDFSRSLSPSSGPGQERVCTICGSRENVHTDLRRVCRARATLLSMIPRNGYIVIALAETSEWSGAVDDEQCGEGSKEEI